VRRVRLPVRTTDRIEDLTAWLLTALGLLAVLGAVAVGLAAHDAAVPPGGVDEPTRVRAVLLADVPPPPAPVRRVPSVAPRVPVAWTAADGTARTGELVVRRPLRAGTEVAAWADSEGRLTPATPCSPLVGRSGVPAPCGPPSRGAEAVAFGVGAGLATAAGAWAVLVLLWSGVRGLTAARNAAAWAREWARVEPLWSRGVR
jgi:hypothetical protein